MADLRWFDWAAIVAVLVYVSGASIPIIGPIIGALITLGGGYNLLILCALVGWVGRKASGL